MNIYFFDDSHIQAMSDLVRVPGPVEKLGPVMNTDDPNRTFDYDPFAGTIVSLPQGGFRAYVSTFHRQSWEHGGGIAVCESDDGLNWREAQLNFSHDKAATPGQIEVNGLPDDFRGYLKQPDVILLPDGTYRMYAWCHGFRGAAPIGRYVPLHSDDGYRFRCDDWDAAILYHPSELGKWGFEAGLVPIDFADAQRATLSPEDMMRVKSQRSNDSSAHYFDAQTGEFKLYSVFLLPNPPGNPRQEERDNARTLLRAVTLRTSRDGFHYSPPELIVAPDERDPLDQQFYYMAVHEQDDWHIGMLGDYEIVEQTMDVQLCFSRDGRNWRRPLRSPLIARDESTFDAKNIYPPQSLIDAGDDWLLLCRSGTHLHNDRRRPNCCMSLARLGKRRFVGLDTARNRDARVLTKGFILTQPEIRLDADIKSTFRAELCDVFGVPLPGFRREDFIPISGDARAHVLRWKEKSTGDYQFDAVSLRLEMSDATLYAIEC